MPDLTANRPVSGALLESAWGGQVHDALEGIQWGTTSFVTTAGAGQITVTFPRPYASAPVCMVNMPTGTGATARTVLRAISTPTNVQIVLFNTDAAGSIAAGVTIPVEWVAFGVPA